ncbi:MAG: N-acetyltransferase, partial [Cyclobacteriaceae bacterium]
IRLLSISGENVGKHKRYEDIAGNLLAYVAKSAVRKYGNYACVSLRPKTQLTQHYINKYNMILTGITVSIIVPEILGLIRQYDHGEEL